MKQEGVFMGWREQYEIHQVIHESAKGAVFAGWDTGTRQEVILRVLYHSNGAVYRVLQQISCPGIPRIYQLFPDGLDTVVVEEKIPGKTLEQRMMENPCFSREEIVRILTQLVQTLEAIHVRGIIHRDIKPSNIVLSGYRTVLIDFDAARQYRENSSARDTVCLGTEGYAPPEQYGFSQTDQRSDLYSLGVLLKELCRHTGEFGLGEVIRRCTAFSPEDRYPSAAALAEDLKRRNLFYGIQPVPSQNPPASISILGSSFKKTVKIVLGIFYALMTAVLLMPMDFEVTTLDYLVSKLVYLQIPLFPAVLTFNWFGLRKWFPLLKRKEIYWKIAGLILYGVVFLVVLISLNAIAFQIYSEEALTILQTPA